MTTAALLNAVLVYGPSIIPLVQKLWADVAAGKGNQTVSAQDMAELVALSKQTSTEIYARLGITPPPAA